jgi:predicted small metal-binding protein
LTSTSTQTSPTLNPSQTTPTTTHSLQILAAQLATTQAALEAEGAVVRSKEARIRSLEERVGVVGSVNKELLWELENIRGKRRYLVGCGSVGAGVQTETDVQSEEEIEKKRAAEGIREKEREIEGVRLELRECHDVIHALQSEGTYAGNYILLLLFRKV